MDTGPMQPVPRKPDTLLQPTPWHALDIGETERRLNSDRMLGISKLEVQRRSAEWRTSLVRRVGKPVLRRTDPDPAPSGARIPVHWSCRRCSYDTCDCFPERHSRLRPGMAGGTFTGSSAAIARPSMQCHP